MQELQISFSFQHCNFGLGHLNSCSIPPWYAQALRVLIWLSEQNCTQPAAH